MLGPGTGPGGYVFAFRTLVTRLQNDTLEDVSTSSRFFGWTAVGLLAMVLGLVVAQSSKLRPITDDYCFGASAVNGPVEAIAEWLTVWTGSPFSAVLQVLLIGWPLAALPLWLSSAISYLASGLAVALLITYLLGSSWKAGRLSMSLLVALFATGWFVVFRIAQVLELRAGDDPIGNRSWEFAEITTHWQTVNTGYVTGSSLAMIALAWAFLSHRLASRRARLISIGIASLLVAWTTYAFAVALAAALLITAFGLYLREKSPYANRAAFASLAILSGVATTFLFPGARARTGADVRTGVDVVLEAVRNVPSGFGEWALDIASTPTLVALLFGIVIASVGVLKVRLRPSSHLVWISGFLLMVSLFIYILNEVTGILIYGRQIWQYVPARLMIFVAAVILGILLVRRLDSMKSFGVETANVLSVVKTLTTVGVVVLSLMGAAVLAASIDSRHDAWEQGPAEIRGIPHMVDRGTPWVEECWRVLNSEQ